MPRRIGVHPEVPLPVLVVQVQWPGAQREDRFLGRLQFRPGGAGIQVEMELLGAVVGPRPLGRGVPRAPAGRPAAATGDVQHDPLGVLVRRRTPRTSA